MLYLLRGLEVALQPEMRRVLVLQEEVEEQRNKSGPARVRRQASEWKESAVEKIAQQVRKGPLLLLQQCYFLGARVRVATRHARGVRGNCTGEHKLQHMTNLTSISRADTVASGLKHMEAQQSSEKMGNSLNLRS